MTDLESTLQDAYAMLVARVTDAARTSRPGTRSRTEPHVVIDTLIGARTNTLRLIPNLVEVRNARGNRGVQKPRGGRSHPLEPWA